MDPIAIASQMLDAVKAYVAKAIEPLNDRLQKAEEAVAETKELAGTSLDILVAKSDEIKSGLAEQVSAEVSAQVEEKSAETIADMRKSIGAMIQKLEAKLVELDELEVVPGKDGRDGRDGQDGRDALIIDVLPGIDETRSYPPRTYASHKGGVWVSRKQTKGMEGWDCIVNGTASVDLVSSGDRDFALLVEHSNGETTSKSFTVPSMIYRGIFQDGQTYQKDDAVTWGGSVWIAQKDGAGKPGEDGDAWKLAVKRGRDGRNGKDGERGPEGKAGPPGRDMTRLDSRGERY